jgi:mono/diheme cytochrome c family protein
MGMRLSIVGLLAVILTAACSAQRARDVRQLSGAEMYERLCSSCHGPTGRGDGPVASLMKVGVPDLTRIAHRDGGEFPTEDIRRTIDGRWNRTAHGARDMPVWGWQLYDISSQNDPAERARVDSMIDRLVNYLRGIQVD